MPDYNIGVIVDPSKAERGSKKASEALGRVETSADKLRNTLRTTFAGITVGALIVKVVKLTDAFTNLQNRIRVVTDTEAELVAVTNELFNISQLTRSSFEGTVELYSRLAISAKELGVSMLDLTRFTKSMNQAIILSGASGREANAGLIQLSQGIASGALRGDELRSVLEQLPVVADVIAKQMGVTRGELRKLGETGSITAQTIIKAFKNAREELEQRFKKTIPTISQAFQVLRNSLVRSLGAFGKASGASELLSKSLIALSNNMETALRLAGALVIVLGVTLAGRVIPALIAKINVLTAAIAANPIGALVVIITTIISLLIVFGDKITVETGKLTTLADVAVATWNRIGKAVASFLNFFQDNFGSMGDTITRTFKGIGLSVGLVLSSIGGYLDIIVGQWITAAKLIKIGWGELANALKLFFSNSINEVITTTEKGINLSLRILNKFLNVIGSSRRLAEVHIGRVEAGVLPSIKSIGEKMKVALKEGMDFNFFRTGVMGILADAEKLAIARSKIKAPTIRDDSTEVIAPKIDSRVVFREQLRLLEQEIQLLQLSSGEHKILNAILAIEKKTKSKLNVDDAKLLGSRLEEIEILTRQRTIYENIISPIKEYKDTLADLNVLLQRGKISQEEFNAALKGTELGSGIQSLRTELFGGDTEAQLEELRNQLDERNIIIQQAREANLINEKESYDLSLQAQKIYNSASLAAEFNRAALLAGSVASVFDSLTNLAKAYGLEQSKFYKTLFLLTKAFVLADASLQIAGAVAKAANTPWPANIAAIAQVASLTAGIINTIASTVYAGAFRTGGDFTVGGSGAPDSKMISFRATPGEQVSIRTPQQARKEATSSNQPTNQVIEQTIINTINPDDIISESSDNAFINKIKSNQETIRNVLGA